MLVRVCGHFVGELLLAGFLFHTKSKLAPIGTQEALDGRTFGDNVVKAVFYEEKLFLRGQYA